MIVETAVSVHFPKAAGFSLKTQLIEHLGESLLLDYHHDPLTPSGNEVSAFPVGKRLVHGHFRAKRYAASDAYFLTFLRDPVDNLISIFYFWKSYPECGNSVHSRFLHEKPSVVEFARYPGLNKLMSETYFGGFDMKRFNFIGFYESRHNDMARLSVEIGLPLNAHLHLNRTADSEERRELMQNQVTLSFLRDALLDDLNFYEALR